MGGTKDGGQAITESRGWGEGWKVSVFFIVLKHTERCGKMKELTKNVKCAV